jgi:hypothetical protein
MQWNGQVVIFDLLSGIQLPRATMGTVSQAAAVAAASPAPAFHINSGFQNLQPEGACS